MLYRIPEGCSNAVSPGQGLHCEAEKLPGSSGDTILILGVSTGPAFQPWNLGRGGQVLFLDVRVSGTQRTTRLPFRTVSPECEDLVLLGELAARGEIRHVIDRTSALDDIVDAHRYVDIGHKRGNVIISVP